MSAPLLSLEQVSKTYTRGFHVLRVLKEVSLEVHAGEFIAIFGQPCSGKTTLLKVAAGLESPDRGAVRFMGEDLNEIPNRRLDDLRLKEIGWVQRGGPQASELPILQHVALPLLTHYGNKRAFQHAREALARVGAEQCAMQTWSKLSDAERTWVSLAQQLAKRPRLLLVDDPTAGLDVLERERVIALLRSIADNEHVGVIMVVPDLPAMLRAHDVRSLSAGRLIAPDPPAGAKLIDFPSGERSA